MSDFEEELLDLRERTSRNRREFLRADLQTCLFAVQRGFFELSLGDKQEAEKEYAIARRGAEVIERFLREAPEQVPEIEPKLAELRESLGSLRRELDTFPS